MTWPTKKLGEIIKLYYGKGISRHDRKSNGKYPIYGANGVLGRADKFLVEGDALIIGRKGSAGEVTKVSGKFWPADVTYYVIGNKQIDINYLFYALKQLDLKQLATGIKPGINRNKVYELKIPLPPIGDQRKIVEKIEKLFAKIDEASCLRAESSILSAALLPSALHQIFSRAEKGGWEEKNFKESIKKQTKKLKGIPKKKYQVEGKFSVVDQGQNLITGYTDDESKIYEGSLPVVIFGDHTRIFKYIDFPFAIGADGTQILIPSNNFYPKYFYYALLALDIENLGYSRHFKILKTKTIPLPSIAEQKKIVAYLDSLSAKSRELQELQLQTANNFDILKRSILAKALTGYYNL